MQAESRPTRRVLPPRRLRAGAAGRGVVLEGVSLRFVVLLLLVLKRLKTPENSHFCTLNSHHRSLGSGMGTPAACGEYGGCDATFRTRIWGFVHKLHPILVQKILNTPETPENPENPISPFQTSKRPARASPECRGAGITPGSGRARLPRSPRGFLIKLVYKGRECQ